MVRLLGYSSYLSMPQLIGQWVQSVQRSVPWTSPDGFELLRWTAWGRHAEWIPTENTGRDTEGEAPLVLVHRVQVSVERSWEPKRTRDPSLHRRLDDLCSPPTRFMDKQPPETRSVLRAKTTSTTQPERKSRADFGPWHS